jgi:hypothetical protein
LSLVVIVTLTLDSVSHLHYDSHPGLLCGVAGSKTVELWAPGDIALCEEPKWPLNVFKGDTAALPPSRVTLTLERGDVLLIPFYWWHLVTSVTDTISVNFWCYPIREVQLRKFADVHLRSSVARIELQRMVLESDARHELALEKNLVGLLARFHRGGTVGAEVFAAQREQLIETVLAALQIKLRK